MTVSNIVNPLMNYLDRFLIGAVVSMAAVAYYSTPYDVITKFAIIPGAFMGVVFPAFSSAFVQDRASVFRIFDRSLIALFVILFPVTLLFVTFSGEGLNLWLGSEFSENGSLVLKLLTIGMFVNSFAYVPFGLLQGAGRPDITAKLHLAEFPFYLLGLWWLLGAYGIVGAAIAWVVRMTVDALLLFLMAHRLASVPSPFTPRPVLIAGMTLFVLFIGSLISGLIIKCLFLLTVISVFVVSIFFFFISKEERTFIFGRLKAYL
jgi:O-antigen/teichoic acid export membrane protein